MSLRALERESRAQVTRSYADTCSLKVQASRTARVRGVLEHLAMTRTREEGGRDRSVSDASTMSGIPDLRRRAPEETMELLCGDRVADPDMKVATLKAYYWRGGVDMVLYWRAKTVNA